MTNKPYYDPSGFLDIRCKNCKSKLRKREYYVNGKGPYCLSCAKFIRHIANIGNDVNMEVK